MMFGDYSLRETLVGLRKEIMGGLLILTMDEDDTLKQLQTIFSQHSMWSLSAVVVLVARQFMSSSTTLTDACTDFLLLDDDNMLEDFLRPETWNDDIVGAAGMAKDAPASEPMETSILQTEGDVSVNLRASCSNVTSGSNITSGSNVTRDINVGASCSNVTSDVNRNTSLSKTSTSDMPCTRSSDPVSPLVSPASSSTLAVHTSTVVTTLVSQQDPNSLSGPTTPPVDELDTLQPVDTLQTSVKDRAVQESLTSDSLRSETLKYAESEAKKNVRSDVSGPKPSASSTDKQSEERIKSVSLSGASAAGSSSSTSVLLSPINKSLEPSTSSSNCDIGSSDMTEDYAAGPSPRMDDPCPKRSASVDSLDDDSALPVRSFSLDSFNDDSLELDSSVDTILSLKTQGPMVDSEQRNEKKSDQLSQHRFNVAEKASLDSFDDDSLELDPSVDKFLSSLKTESLEIDSGKRNENMQSAKLSMFSSASTVAEKKNIMTSSFVDLDESSNDSLPDIDLGISSDKKPIAVKTEVKLDFPALKSGLSKAALPEKTESRSSKIPPSFISQIGMDPLLKKADCFGLGPALEKKRLKLDKSSRYPQPVSLSSSHYMYKSTWPSAAALGKGKQKASKSSSYSHVDDDINCDVSLPSLSPSKRKRAWSSMDTERSAPEPFMSNYNAAKKAKTLMGSNSVKYLGKSSYCSFPTTKASEPASSTLSSSDHLKAKSNPSVAKGNSGVLSSSVQNAKRDVPAATLTSGSLLGCYDMTATRTNSLPKRPSATFTSSAPSSFSKRPSATITSSPLGSLSKKPSATITSGELEALTRPGLSVGSSASPSKYSLSQPSLFGKTPVTTSTTTGSENSHQSTFVAKGVALHESLTPKTSAVVGSYAGENSARSNWQKRLENLEREISGLIAETKHLHHHNQLGSDVLSLSRSGKDSALKSVVPSADSSSKVILPSATHMPHTSSQSAYQQSKSATVNSNPTSDSSQSQKLPVSAEASLGKCIDYLKLIRRGLKADSKGTACATDDTWRVFNTQASSATATTMKKDEGKSNASKINRPVPGERAPFALGVSEQLLDDDDGLGHRKKKKKKKNKRKKGWRDEVQPIVGGHDTFAEAMARRHKRRDALQQVLGTHTNPFLPRSHARKVKNAARVRDLDMSRKTKSNKDPLLAAANAAAISATSTFNDSQEDAVMITGATPASNIIIDDDDDDSLLYHALDSPILVDMNLPGPVGTGVANPPTQKPGAGGQPSGSKAGTNQSAIGNLGSMLPNVAPVLTNVAPKLPSVVPILSNVAPKLPIVVPILSNVAPKLPSVVSKLPSVVSKLPNIAPKLPNIAPKLPSVAPISPIVGAYLVVSQNSAMHPNPNPAGSDANVKAHPNLNPVVRANPNPTVVGPNPLPFTGVNPNPAAGTNPSATGANLNPAGATHPGAVRNPNTAGTTQPNAAGPNANPGSRGADPVPDRGNAVPVAVAPPPVPPPAKHPGLEFGVQNVLEVFPGTDRQYVTQLLEGYLTTHTLDHALNMTMDHLLENPRPAAAARGAALEPEVTVVHLEEPSASNVNNKDYYKDYNVESTIPRHLVVDRLAYEFRTVRMDTIQAIVKRYKGHYAPAHRSIIRAMEAAMVDLENQRKASAFVPKRPQWIDVKIHEGQPNEEKIRFSLMKGVRAPCESKLHCTNPELLAQIQFIELRARHDKEETDRKVAWALLESEYEAEGQSIECGCCYAEQAFENLVQCFDGHLFCCQCLVGYAREAVFGSGKLHLGCMTDGCDSKFPKSQLVKALPSDIIAKYDERLAEESLNKAAMEDLVRCPKCNFAVALDPRIPNFKCPNDTCRKETCRKCKEDWAEHKGKTCEQVEKKDETRLRTGYEEKMTAARVRECVTCKAQFYKEEGCNKMTCRCGTTMCYICRQAKINYQHFCQHPRDPGKECNECKKCFLWSNPTEDEQRAIAEIQKEAQEKRRQQGFLEERVVGVPDQPPAKKKK